MKILDTLACIVTHSLARLGAPVPAQTHTVRTVLKQNSAAECGRAVRLVESAFPMLAIPGFWEMLRKCRSEQAHRELSSDFDPEDCNRFIKRGSWWNYTIVPWED
jgi:hypothetical protein